MQKSFPPNTVIADATRLQAPYNKLLQKVVNYVCIVFTTLRCTRQFFFNSYSFLTDEFWRYITSDYAAYPVQPLFALQIKCSRHFI